MDKTIELDDELIREAQDLTGETNERQAVETVLRSSLRARRKNRDLMDLVGKIEFDEDFDPKKLRFSRYDPD